MVRLVAGGAVASSWPLFSATLSGGLLRCAFPIFRLAKAVGCPQLTNKQTNILTNKLFFVV